jgi:hypothetical protein
MTEPVTQTTTKKRIFQKGEAVTFYLDEQKAMHLNTRGYASFYADEIIMIEEATEIAHVG